jgi:hypothetical protein
LNKNIKIILLVFKNINMNDILEPSEIPENNKLQEYNYCKSNQEVIDSKA